MYQKVSTDLKFVDREKKTEKFWEENDIFRKSMENRTAEVGGLQLKKHKDHTDGPLLLRHDFQRAVLDLIAV